MNKIQRLIFYFVLLSGLNHVTAIIVRDTKITDGINTYVFHVYVPILFYLTWRIYKEALKSIFSKRFFQVLLFLFLGFCVVNSVLIQSFYTNPTNAIFLMSLVFIFWSFAYFVSLLKSKILQPLEKKPLFWLSTGQLIYYSSTILIFLLIYNYLIDDTEATYIAITLNAFFNLVLVTSYLIALWVRPEK